MREEKSIKGGTLQHKDNHQSSYNNKYKNKEIAMMIEIKHIHAARQNILCKNGSNQARKDDKIG